MVAPKDSHIQVRVTEAEKAAFTKAAAKAGLSLSQWLRTLARKAARMETI